MDDLRTEQLLIEQGFTAYTHADEGDTIFWSKTDLMAGDNMKKWFYA